MTINTTRRRVLAGVAGGAVATAAGISVATPANAERPALSGPWQEWQRLKAEILRRDSQEPDDAPWHRPATPFLRQVAHKFGTLNPTLSPEDVDEICNSFGPARDDLCDTRCAIEDQIVRTPARTTQDVLIKLRVACYWIETDNTVGGSVLINNPTTSTESNNSVNVDNLDCP